MLSEYGGKNVYQFYKSKDIPSDKLIAQFESSEAAYLALSKFKNLEIDGKKIAATYM